MQQDVQEVGHGLGNPQEAHPVDLLVVVLWFCHVLMNPQEVHPVDLLVVVWFCLVALQHIVRRRASTEYFWKTSSQNTN